MASCKSSILIFEMKKKYLLYKILTKELKSHLKSEIWKNFGAKYIREKNEQNSEFYSVDANQSDETGTNPSSASNFNLTNDLIYEYFSALVASYEISKEISYVYEYALFDQNRYIIRFHQYKNFLLMILFNAAGVSAGLESFEVRNQLFAEYYTSWFCKSVVSLLKYKFGISTDDRCLKDTDEPAVEIRSLFVKWSHLFHSENLYFVEAIEKLEVFPKIVQIYFPHFISCFL